jgi:hypothetical protein
MASLMAGSLCNNRARYYLVALAGLFIIYLITTSTKTGAFGSLYHSTKGGGSKSVPVDVNEDVAFCIATKDHPDDLVEFFVHHYHHHGIQRFYIMDDGSATPLSSFKDYGIPRSHLSF